MASIDVDFRAADDWRDLAAALRRAGATSLQKQLYAATARSARKFRPAVQASARARLPSGGGYVSPRRRRRSLPMNERVADSAFKLSVRQLSGGMVTARFTATSRKSQHVNLFVLDDTGLFRHPLFGDTEHWYDQRTVSGYFHKPLEGQEESIYGELRNAVDEVVKEIDRGRA